MTTSKADAERNLKEFLDKYGREGFLRLLLTNYLFELAMYYLHTDKNPAAQVGRTQVTGSMLVARSAYTSPMRLSGLSKTCEWSVRRKLC